MTNYDVSVVIGFRDWGVERLVLAIQSIKESFGKLSGELILVDYGSKDPAVATEIAKRFELKLVAVPDAPVWSRSRALNAGFAIASGELYISTDADMLFAPKTLETVFTWFRAAPESAFFLQCRDLPQGVSVADLSGASIDWQELESTSTLRPRWGVGGLMAISRNAFRELRGLDERMLTYGREDMDFALRARRLGYRMVWVEERAARIYHIWHPSSADAVKSDAKAISSVDSNRKIYDEDKTSVRNREIWIHGDEDPLPIVSVLLVGESARNRDLVDMLRLQTVSSIEIIIVDDSTMSCISDIDDRIRFVPEINDRLLDLEKYFRGRYVLPLMGIDLVSRNFLETLLGSIVEDSSLIVADGACIRRSDDGYGAGRVNLNTLGVLLEKELFKSLLSHFGEFASLTQEKLISVCRRNGLTSVFVKDAFFVVDEPPRDPRHDLGMKNSRIDSTIFWPFERGRNKILSARITSANVSTLRSESFEGELGFSHITVNGKTLLSEARLENASLNDLLVLRQSGHSFESNDQSEIRNSKLLDGYAWALRALESVLRSITWTPESAFFVDPISYANVASKEFSVGHLSTLGFNHSSGSEELILLLSQNSSESAFIIDVLRNGIKFMATGPV